MKKRGFTLLELITVLAIMSIFMAAGVFKFNLIHRFKAKNEIESMVNDINYAKMKALSTGRPYKLILTKNSYSIRQLDSENNGEIIYKELDYLDIGFDEYNFSKTITYTASGGVNNPGTIYLRINDDYDMDQVYKLVITVAGGHSRIEKDKEWIYFD